MVWNKSFFLVIALLFTLDYSKAQSFRLLDAQGKPVAGAVVTYASLDQQKSTVKISDNQGLVDVPNVSFPQIRVVNMLGFRPETDTLKGVQEATKDLQLGVKVAELQEVTVTGSIVPNFQGNAVYQVKVLDREVIERKAATSVNELLAQELNLSINNDPALGTNLSMMGTGGEHIKFLVDGIPVIGRKNGMIDLSQLNLSNIAKVEIVKGPMSVLYGSDALGGVVNLITKKPAQEKFSVGTDLLYETNGTYNGSLNAGWSYKKGSVMIDGGRNFFDGWNKVDTARWQAWKPKEQYFANLKTSWVFGNAKLTAQASFFKDKVIDKSNPFITPYYATAIDQYFRTTRSNVQLQAEKQFTQKSNLQFQAAYSYYQSTWNTYIKDMVDLTQELTPDTLDDDTTKMNSVFLKSLYSQTILADKLVMMTGAEFNTEAATGQRIDGEEHRITDVSLFATAEYTPLTGLTIRPSLRAIYNSEFAAPVIPAVNLLWKCNAKLDLRSSWSLGYRAPSIKELYLYFVDNGPHNVRGNANLGAEHSQHLSLSADYRFAHKKVVATLSPSLFYSEIANRISLVQVDVASGLYSYINTDHFTSRGAEVNVKFAMDRFNVCVGTSYLGTTESFGGDKNQPEVVWHPEANAGIEYKLKKSLTTVSLWWKYTGEQPLYVLESGDVLNKYTNEAYQMMDASVRHVFIQNKLAVTIGARNLFDVTDVRMASNGSIHGGGPSGGTSESPVGMGRIYFTKISLSL